MTLPHTTPPPNPPNARTHTHTQVRQDNGRWLKGELVGRPKKLKYTIAFSSNEHLESLELGSPTPQISKPRILGNPDPA